MPRALIVNCSPVRNGATARIAEIIADELAGRFEVGRVCIDDYSFAFCRYSSLSLAFSLRPAELFGAATYCWEILVFSLSTDILTWAYTWLSRTRSFSFSFLGGSGTPALKFPVLSYGP